MSILEGRFEEGVASLRRDFDRSFAAVPQRRSESFDDFLLIRVGSEPHALRLDEIAGLHPDRTIVPMRSRSEAFLGIVGFRNRLTPIYSLHLLLGYSGGVNPRWIVLGRGQQALGFAFDGFDGFFRAPRDKGAEPAGDSAARSHLRGSVRADVSRPIIGMTSLFEAILRLCSSERAHLTTQPGAAEKER